MIKLPHLIVASLAAAHLIVPPPLPAGDLDGLFFFNDEDDVSDFSESDVKNTTVEEPDFSQFADPKDNPPPEPEPAPAEIREPKRKAASIKRLHLTSVGQLSSGGISAVTAKASGGSGNALSLSLGNVDNDLDRAVANGVKFLEKRAGKAWPAGASVTISFSKSPGDRELDSAALPAALLVDSITNGHELDDGIAAVGGISENGFVKPVNRIGPMVRGFDKSEVDILIVPSSGIDGLKDLLLLNEVDAVCGTQIITVNTLAGASAIARKDRPKEIQEALDNYQKIVDFAKQKGRELPQIAAQSSQVKSVLQDILKKMPYHFSARCLLLSTNQPALDRQSLSRTASLDYLSVVAEPVATMMVRGTQNVTEELCDICSDQLFKIQRVRTRLSKSALPYADAMSDFLEVYKKFRGMNPASPTYQALKREQQLAERNLRIQTAALASAASSE